MREEGDVKERIRKLGYKAAYIPHEVIDNYNACFRVKYNGKLILASAADKLGIPLNEIWISKKWKEFEEYILYQCCLQRNTKRIVGNKQEFVFRTSRKIVLITQWTSS